MTVFAELFLFFIIFGLYCSCGLRVLCTEQAVGDALILEEDLVNQVLVLGRSVQELDLWLRCGINVRCVIIIVFDGLDWVHDLTDVDRRGISLLLQIIHESLQLVGQILRNIDLLLEHLPLRLQLIGFLFSS